VDDKESDLSKAISFYTGFAYTRFVGEDHVCRDTSRTDTQSRLVWLSLHNEKISNRLLLRRSLMRCLVEGWPFWIHRLNDHTHFAAKQRALKTAPAQYPRDKLVVTTSGNFFMPAIQCTLMAIWADTILFSVDWPYESNRIAGDWLSHLQISEQK